MSNLNNKISYKELKNEFETKFKDYDFGELAFDQCFHLICNNTNNIKDIFIISSFLRQIEPTLDEIKETYSLDDNYINNIISTKLPELRVLAYNRDSLGIDEDAVFFPEFHTDNEYLYIEFAKRIEYFFERKRNITKLLSNKKNQDYLINLIDNDSYLFLLNFLSITDSLLIGSSLNIIDIDDDVLSNVFQIDEDNFKIVFDQYIYMIKSELSNRINILENIEIETSFFDYTGLCNKYKDLNKRIEDTLNYMKIKNKKR